MAALKHKVWSSMKKRNEAASYGELVVQGDELSELLYLFATRPLNVGIDTN